MSDEQQEPAVVLYYVGDRSAHGVLLPPAYVPARDLTKADIDELPMRYGNLIGVDEEGVRTYDSPPKQMTVSDLLALDPPIFSKSEDGWKKTFDKVLKEDLKTASNFVIDDTPADPPVVEEQKTRWVGPGTSTRSSKRGSKE